MNLHNNTTFNKQKTNQSAAPSAHQNWLSIIAKLQQLMTTNHLSLSSSCILHLFNLLHRLIQLLLQTINPARQNNIFH